MIALGWTAQGMIAPARFTMAGQPHCTTIAVAERDAATPRDRMRLQLDCARTLPAFLPLAPTLRMCLDEACDHGHRHGMSIATRLEALRGRVQISLRVLWPTEGQPAPQVEASVPTGRDWLVARASGWRGTAARRARIAGGVRDALSTWSAGPVSERHDARGLQIDTLVPSRRVSDLDTLGRALRCAPDLAGAALALSGPWPALSFASLAGAGP